MRFQNHVIHIGQHHTRGEQLRQHKRPQTSDIPPKSNKKIWKQVYLISRMYDIYQSMDSGIYLVQVYGHHNSGGTASNLTPLAFIKVGLDALAEHIIL